MSRITVYGAGAWGTALALTFDRKGLDVTLLVRREDHAHWIQESRTNERYLPGCLLPNSIHITADKAVLSRTDILIWVIPTQYTANELTHLGEKLPSHIPIVICSKGIVVGVEPDVSFLMNLMSKRISNPLAVLSGPNFAKEVARGLPAAATLAAFDEHLAEKLACFLRHPEFRIYASKDPMGVQVAGAIKNVIAIASGIVVGKELGHNANAALMTRGLAEMRRLGVVLGANVETFLGLSAVGDLTLTCSNEQSRNMSLGIALAEGNRLEDILTQRHTISEGVYTAKAAHLMAKALNVPMPICQGVYEILYENAPVNDVIQTILSKQTSLEVA
jgi:glycerol-3-phosphate dehydrogenase (NAD(P)+)